MRSVILGGYVTLFIALFFHGTPATAVVGGDPIDNTLQQYTVAVGGTKGRCTGVVLEQNIVLTAAHCTQDSQNLWVGGHRGWGDLSNPPVGLSPVVEVVQHPGYREKSGWPDLALLKLEKPLPDRFIPAYFGGYTPHNGDGLIAAGYGEGFANDPTGGTVLRMVLLRVSAGTSGYLTLVSPGEAIAGSGHGDSGGPVFAYRGMHALVGIVVGHVSNATMAVAIAPYYVWIKDTIEKLNSH
jgi:secreted trypsin-like serine protease